MSDPSSPRSVTTVDGVNLVVPPALDGAAHATLSGIRGQPVTAARVADLMLMHLHHQGFTVAPRIASPDGDEARKAVVATPAVTPAPFQSQEGTDETPILAIGGRPYRLRLGIGDHLSLVAILQSEAETPFNDHGNLRRMTTALVNMVLEFAQGNGITDPEAMITFAQDLLREEFYPVHAARQERLAQQARPM